MRVFDLTTRCAHTGQVRVIEIRRGILETEPILQLQIVDPLLERQHS